MSFARLDELLGAPLVIRTENLDSTKRYTQLHHSQYAYVVATGENKEESVDAFAITIRRRSFTLPVKSLMAEQLKAKLPKTTFTEVHTDWSTQGQRFVVGANRHGYSEIFYFGNPGHYQTYILAYNDAGVGSFSVGEEFENFRTGDFVNTVVDTEQPTGPSGSWFEDLYRTLKPNTVAVVGAHATVRMITNELSVGVDYSLVRQIPH